MAHFHSLRVREVRRETPDCVSVAFEVPDELKAAFAFLPGQNLTLRTQIQDEEVRRSYSICVSPQKGELRVAIKKLSGGQFSTWANTKLKAGDMLDVMPPSGRFTLQTQAEASKHYVGIAAGSGITPIMSMIEAVLENEPQSSFSLLYGNRSLHSVIFREQLEQLKNQHLGRFQIWQVLSREMADSPLFQGRIDEEKCQTIFTKILPATSIDAYYLCGPEEMVMQLKQTLQQMGVDQSKIHFELFATGLAKKAGERKPIDPELAEKLSQVSITLDDFTYQYELGYNSVSILDAATAAGADVPFSCKGGVCATCRAKLIRGEVEMTLNYSLEPDEIAQGYILTCQSHPRSPEIEIDFDA